MKFLLNSADFFFLYAVIHNTHTDDSFYPRLWYMLNKFLHFSTHRTTIYYQGIDLAMTDVTVDGTAIGQPF